MVFVLSVSQVDAQLDRWFIKPFKQEKSVTYGLNNRRTQLFDENGTIYGAYAGIQFGNNLKHVATINSNVFWIGSNTEHFPQASEVQLNFVGVSEEYIFWKRNQWSFNSYLHIGVGKARVRPVSAVIQETPYASQWVVPLEGGIQNQYDINKWLSVRGGVGYRYVFNSNDWPLHGMYAKIGVGVKFKELMIVINQMRQIPENILPRR